MRTVHLFWWVLFLFAPANYSFAETAQIQLVTDSETLSPTSTIEIRFPTAMIPKEAVGTLAEPSPIEISPGLSGNFTWLSRRSGVFSISSAPSLGTRYIIHARSGLVDSDGKPVGQGWQAELETPPYMVTWTGVEGDEGSALPDVDVAFNLKTQLESGVFRFVAPNRPPVAATVRYAVGNRDYFPRPPDAGDWEERWQNRNRVSDTNEEKLDVQLQDRLIVTPTEPLEPSQAWVLEIGPGVRSLDSKHLTESKKLVPLKEIKPFTVESLNGVNYIHSGKAIVIQFSNWLAPDLGSENISQYMTVEPEVPGLKYELDEDTVRLRGNFQLGQTYKVRLSPELVDRNGLSLSGDLVREVQIGPVKPRIYLPTAFGDQYQDGRRQFEILSVNLARLHVRAKLIDPDATPGALEAFVRYDQPDENEKPQRTEDEPNKQVAERDFKGRVVFDQSVPIANAQLDTQVKTALDWNTLLGAQRGGLVLLTIEGEPIASAGHAKIGAQALIQLTDIGVFWARAGNVLEFTCFSLATGKPLAEAQVQTLLENHSSAGKTTTNENGLAVLPFSPQVGWLLVKTKTGNYTLRLGKQAKSLEMWGFNLEVSASNWEESTAAAQERLFVFTDRPLYRQGDTVHIKALLRRMSPNGLAFGSGESGQLVITNAAGEQVFSRDIKTDSIGAFDLDVPVTASFSGRHFLRIQMPDSNTSGETAFVVADYEPNAFEVNLKLPDRLTADETARAELSASYLFGAKVERAQIRWTLQSLPSLFEPEGFDDFVFGSSSDEKPTTVGGTLDYPGTGPVVIQPTLPPSNGQLLEDRLTVQVTDLNQQTVTESKLFYRDPAAFYIGLERGTEGVISAGEKLPLRCIAVNSSGKPLSEPVPVHVSILRKRYNTIRIKNAGKGVSFRSETIEEPVAELTGQTLVPVFNAGKWQIGDGVTVEFPTKEAGEYIVRATGRDPNGHSAMSETDFVVSGPDEVAWAFRNAAQIDIVTDKESYSPGETARILVKSPFSGEAFITVARTNQVLRTLAASLTGNTPTFEVPILAGDSPNIYVSVVLVRGWDESTRKIKAAEFRYGLASLKVREPQNELNVAIQSSQSRFEPNQPVDVDLRVTDDEQVPVGNADVTFMALDDGVLALTAYERPDPGHTFYKPFSLGVEFGMTLENLLAEDPTDLRFTNKGYLIGGGGLEGPESKLRRNYPGTACWIASIKTDPTGHARVRFQAPDAITRYRLVAVATAGPNRFGSAESSITIAKPVLILPSLTQFMRTGDQITARAVVRNDSGQEQSLQAILKLDKLVVATGSTVEQIVLGNGESRTIDVKLRAHELGVSNWEWSISNSEHGDRVGGNITIQAPGPSLRETYLADGEGGSLDLLRDINPQLTEGAGVVRVTLANTRLTSLQPAVTALRTYPYDCSEQLTSGLVPFLVEKQLRNVLSTPVVATLDTGVVSGILSELFERQTGSGGLALWPREDQPSFFASAYAAYVMGGLRKLGVELPEDKYKNLLDYLATSLRGTTKLQADAELSDDAFALLALATAGRPESSYMEELRRRLPQLSRETRAVLALAYLNASSTRGNVDALLNPKTPAPEAESFYSGDAREPAIQLLAYTTAKSKSADIAPLLKELLGLRRSGSWQTTQENAWSLLACVNYYRQIETGPKKVDTQLVTGSETLSVHLEHQNPVWSKVFKFDSASPLKQLTIDSAGKGLYADTSFEVFPSVGVQPRQDRGFSVTREYWKVNVDGERVAAQNLQVGDRILVQVQVTTRNPARLVAIDDSVPGNLEVINPDFRLSDAGVNEDNTSSPFFDYRIIRNGHVQFFCNQLPSGSRVFSYLARVRLAGDTVAPGAQTLEMYRPDRFGLSESSRVVTTAAGE